ncbi:hypothetical protein ACFLUJ_03165 [Chloroflexota bacterium]
MAESKTIQWVGKSGIKYTYYILELSTAHNAVPANYIFAKETKPNTWSPVYIGETGDISERFDSHHKIDCIRLNGATHIHTHKSSDDRTIRQKEESDLITGYSPTCNG